MRPTYPQPGQISTSMATITRSRSARPSNSLTTPRMIQSPSTPSWHSARSVWRNRSQTTPTYVAAPESKSQHRIDRIALVLQRTFLWSTRYTRCLYFYLPVSKLIYERQRACLEAYPKLCPRLMLTFDALLLDSWPITPRPTLQAC